MSVYSYSAISFPPDPPMARITHEMFGHSSIGGVLRVIAEEGDPSPTFFCSSDGLPIPVITWSGQNGGVELPNDVILRVEQTTSNLVWNRRLEYTDSGFYECTAQNSQRISVARLELLVQSKYTTSPLGDHYRFHGPPLYNSQLAMTQG